MWCIFDKKEKKYWTSFGEFTSENSGYQGHWSKEDSIQDITEFALLQVLYLMDYADDISEIEKDQLYNLIDNKHLVSLDRKTGVEVKINIKETLRKRFLEVVPDDQESYTNDMEDASYEFNHILLYDFILNQVDYNQHYTKVIFHDAGFGEELPREIRVNCIFPNNDAIWFTKFKSDELVLHKLSNEVNATYEVQDAKKIVENWKRILPLEILPETS